MYANYIMMIYSRKVEKLVHFVGNVLCTEIGADGEKLVKSLSTYDDPGRLSR